MHPGVILLSRRRRKPILTSLSGAAASRLASNAVPPVGFLQKHGGALREAFEHYPLHRCLVAEPSHGVERF